MWSDGTPAMTKHHQQARESVSFAKSKASASRFADALACDFKRLLFSLTHHKGQLKGIAIPARTLLKTRSDVYN